MWRTRMQNLLSIIFVFAFNMNTYAIDLSNCESIEWDQFSMKIDNIHSNRPLVEFFIKDVSIGKDVVKMTVLKVGAKYEGAKLYYLNSFHDGESLVADLENERCFVF
jgi:hypothetical protein